ncbi:hypothetical protein WA1_47420 [Scytonema hofmannii PCC 7110]|uniref:Uncharacterized protein n=1 Tax=Scytonema hofmannii PCC 7110 TaxID=128403 RepID=A0A139WXT4_9CYAN|nr:hypothetical protein [Scytonema hofmannii]KYC37255.1 hypothetical protein WA1_47420 [Scytonema hofmannii PCC 7110]
MDEVNLGPFNRLLDIEGVNGPEDIFGNVGGSFSGDNPFTMGSSSSNIQDLPYNGNPFAGDNFWNIFAGGVNPSNPSFGSGGDTFGGGF